MKPGLKLDLSQVQRNLRTLQRELQGRLRREVAGAMAQVIQRDAEASAPRDTGALAGSGRIEQDPKWKGAAKVIFGERAKNKRGRSYAKAVEFGTESHDPEPFLLPAADSPEVQAAGASAAKKAFRAAAAAVH